MPMAADSHRSGRGQAVHRPAPRDDDAGAEKPYARDDLGGNAGRVKDHAAGMQHVGESVLADQQDQRRRGADDGLRAQARALALDLALQPDQRGQAERHQQLDDLTGPLPGASEQRRISQQHEHVTNVATTCDHGDPNGGRAGAGLAVSAGCGCG